MGRRSALRLAVSDGASLELAAVTGSVSSGLTASLGVAVEAIRA